MRVPVRNVGSIGIVNDIPSSELPLEAWSDGKNVRMMRNAVWKSFGNTPLWGTPSGIPSGGLFPIVGDGTTQFYVYPGTTDVWATDGTNHAEITRVSGDYTGTLVDRWNGGPLGGLLILNNGIDVPQVWTPSLGTDLIDLPNWTPGYRAKCLRTFRQFIFALDTLEGGVRRSQRVRWSAEAVAGAVPVTWDPTITSQQARHYDLLQSDGAVIDAIPLGNYLAVYKEDQTYAVDYIGGHFVFRFDLRFPESGILAQGCAMAYLAKHVAMTHDDIVIHDLFQMDSLLEGRLRDWYSGRLDLTNAFRSFLAYNPMDKTLWACFPESGETYPNIAIVLNPAQGVRPTIRDIPPASGAIHVFPITTAVGGSSFDAQTATFDAMIGQFGGVNFQAGRKRLVFAVPGASAGASSFQMAEQTFQFNGANFRGFVERTGFSFVMGRNGPIADMESVKVLQRLWIKAQIANGSALQVYVGGHDKVDGPITWKGPFAFDPVTMPCLSDCEVEGRFLAFRFETSDGTYFKLDSYEPEFEVIGVY